jgi:hypothetical protein
MEGKNADNNDDQQSCHAQAATSTSSIITKRTEDAYRAALERLVQGRATHPKYAGRPIKITPSAVAREASQSRNPLYTTHRALLSEIEAAAQRPSPAAENLALLQRARQAEDRLASRDREAAELRRKPGRLTVVK